MASKTVKRSWQTRLSLLPPTMNRLINELNNPWSCARHGEVFCARLRGIGLALGYEALRSSAASVTQRLQVRQAKVCKSTSPSVPRTVRANRSACPQLGQVTCGTESFLGGRVKAACITKTPVVSAHPRRCGIQTPV